MVQQDLVQKTEALPDAALMAASGRHKSSPGRRRARIRRPAPTLALSERKLLLLGVDIALLNAALVLGLRLAPRTTIAMSWHVLVTHLQWFIVLTGLWWLIAVVLNTYNLRTSADRLRGPLTAITTLLCVAVVYFFIPYLSAPLTSTRLAWALFFVLAAVGLAVWRYFYALVLVQPQFRRRVVIVGAGRSGQAVLDAIEGNHQAEIEVLGFIDDDPAKAGRLIGAVPVVGNRYDLLQEASDLGIEEVILAITNSQEIHGDLFQALMDCHELGVRVVPMAQLYEELTNRVAVEHIGQQLYALLPLNQNPALSFYGLVRRAVDLLLGLVGLLLLMLLLPIIAVMIWLDSPGPVFYRQVRVGKGGRQFTLLKLRTMVPDAEGTGAAVWAKAGDDRVTRFGRLARKIRLDEVPQLWNVLKGDMSLIGPRPERPEFVEQLQKQIPFYRSRHAVKPGITGWAQVSYGYGNSVEDAMVKLQYDLYYIKHQSLYLDLLILLKTAGTVLTLGGT
jgi:exopolysaccharide biosynthesis polyprenyl glycosylphosphotransferase